MTIKSISFSQDEIIQSIINLHLGGKDIECDPTYSKGNFYKKVNKPAYRFDFAPQDTSVVQADCRKLPLPNVSVESIMFDPPFIIGGSSKSASYANPKAGSNIIHRRFSSFSSPQQMVDMYRDSLKEFHRVLKNKGVLIFKCQDQISGGKQYLSHVMIVNMAIEMGFYPKDMFVLLAKNRMSSGKWTKQEHARKFHSYFLVFTKEKSKVDYGIKQNLSGQCGTIGSLGNPRIISGYDVDIPTLRQA